MNNIVIIGSGFGALTTVRSLRKRGYKDTITLIAPKPEMFYYPSLIWVPARWRDQNDLTIGLDSLFRKNRVEYISGRAIGLDPDGKKVITDQGQVEFDHLVIACGGCYIKKLPGVKEHTLLPCEGWEPTASYRDRFESLDGGTLAFGFAGNPKEPAAMRGGPLFEFLFGMESLLRKRKQRDRFEMVFFSPAPKPGKRLGTKAVDRLLAEMKRRRINYHIGHKIKSFEPDRIITEGGEISSDLTMFLPGMTGPAWAADSGLPLSPGGFFQADASCRVTGHDTIFVVGDAGSFPGPEWLPKQAHLADLQAHTTAKNLMATLHGKPAEYKFRPELICIVDTLDNGILVFRNTKLALMLKGRPMHWSKRLFERLYLNRFR